MNKKQHLSSVRYLFLHRRKKKIKGRQNVTVAQPFHQVDLLFADLPIKSIECFYKWCHRTHIFCLHVSAQQDFLV